MQDKIRLGHDLHDGIIQSLYAAGLTLESTRALLASNPAEADRRLEQCRDALNGTIREVRAYITGLAPQNLSSATFRRTLHELLTPLTRGFDPARARGAGFGLGTLEARAQRLGGRCTIESQRGVGTRVALEFPFASAA